jgi:hypothetical protein
MACAFRVAFRRVLARLAEVFARFFEAFALRATFGRDFFDFTGLRRDLAAPRPDFADPRRAFLAGFRRFDDLDLAISVLQCVPVDPMR